MTKDEAIKYLNEFIVLKKISNITEEKAIECFKLAVEALEQEPCKDAISRAEALKVVDDMDIPEDMSEFEIKSHIGVEISTLPPVTSTRMKGKWINILPCTTNFQDQIIYQCVCDRCSSIAYFRKMCGKLVGANLCPVCGAEMQEVEE